ncbi:hypothetical protein B7994_11360 [Fibrobacter sp. UWR2]|nr:hypothetical protein B7994_11360 [Fibrobacter sp. UWR2]
MERYHDHLVTVQIDLDIFQNRNQINNLIDFLQLFHQDDRRTLAGSRCSIRSYRKADDFVFAGTCAKGQI